jgi:Rrf2 family protein
MKISAGVEWALHCCLALSGIDRPVPAAKLAEMTDVSASYLAKQLQALSRAGLVTSVQGKAGGYVLTRSPEKITVLDVVQAIEGTATMFECTEIRQRGPVGAPPEECRQSCAVAKAMLAGEQAWRTALRGITLQDVGTEMAGTISPERMARMLNWMQPSS